MLLQQGHSRQSNLEEMAEDSDDIEEVVVVAEIEQMDKMKNRIEEEDMEKSSGEEDTHMVPSVGEMVEPSHKEVLVRHPEVSLPVVPLDGDKLDVRNPFEELACNQEQMWVEVEGEIEAAQLGNEDDMDMKFDSATLDEIFG